MLWYVVCGCAFLLQCRTCSVCTLGKLSKIKWTINNPDYVPEPLKIISVQDTFCTERLQPALFSGGWEVIWGGWTALTANLIWLMHWAVAANRSKKKNLEWSFWIKIKRLWNVPVRWGRSVTLDTVLILTRL